VTHFASPGMPLDAPVMHLMSTVANNACSLHPADD